jgi:uncharacterized protein
MNSILIKSNFFKIQFLAGIGALFMAGTHTSAQSPFAKVESISHSEMKWTSGFWHERFTVCKESMIPSMWEIMKGTDYKPFLQHFEIAAGLKEGSYHGATWNDGDFYKWMEAVCAAQSVDFDPVWEERLDNIISIIAKAQREDGYIHTPTLIAARNGNIEAKPFYDRFNFEMYNMGHLMTTACLHYEVTGKDSLLNVALKAADFLDAAFQSPTSEQARHAVCPSHYMGIIELYRVTGEVRYLRLAERLIFMRDLVNDGGDDNQDRVDLVNQNEVVGHAVRANYLYAGIADLCAETGDAELGAMLERVWQNMVEKKMYITGGCGALHDGALPDGSKDQKSITRVHQAYGRNYQLPNSTAHNETCANIGNVLWNWRMFLVKGEVRFIDVMELALYNSTLSGMDLSGKNFFYTNPLRKERFPAVNLRWPSSRKPFYTSFCCPPNLVRMIAGVGSYAYSKSDTTIWVNLYGSNVLSTILADGNKIRMKQETSYPWNGEIRITVEECQDRPFSLKLRIPGWAKSAELKVDGFPSNQVLESCKYVEIRRSWKPGETIELDLEMPPVLIEGHPLIEETRNHVALKRGPVVYCLESTDLPDGTQMADVKIAGNIQFEATYKPDLLQGVTVLEGTVNLQKQGDWSGKLYRDFDPGKSSQVKTRFIPYYAWANRGESEMSVWLPMN